MSHHPKLKSTSRLSMRRHAPRPRRALRTGWRAGLLLMAASVLMLCLAIVLAAPGDLDPTFDGDGLVTTEVSGVDTVKAVAIQPDGKIVAAGAAHAGSTDFFIVARYNANGSLDSSFDGDGKASPNFGPGSDVANAVAIQPDGKIIAAGYAQTGTAPAFGPADFALVRCNADGSLDTSFDGDGKLTTDFNTGGDVAYAVAVQPDGKIIAAGFAYDSSTFGAVTHFALVRYNANGSLDSSFGTGGKLTTNFGAADEARAIALQPDGKIVAAGFYSATGDFAVARYNADGSLDSSFDGDGKLTTDFGTNADAANAVAIQPDGKIVVAGASSAFRLARYNTNGSLDDGTASDSTPGDSFGTSGKLTTFVGGNGGGSGNEATAVALQPDGKIIAAGSVFVSRFNFGLARYDANGTPDGSFDGDGQLTTSFPPGTQGSAAYAVALQPDGRIVAAGSATTTGNPDFALARYAGDTKPNRTANFDTDRKTDIAAWNPSSGNWLVLDSTDNSFITRQWGSAAAGDRIVPGDYDGDGKTDFAVFRPSEGNWYILKSGDGTATLRNWGNASDIPVAGDYDLDGKTDAAVYRPSEANWYILNSRDNTARSKTWGASGDIPVPADYDGDGATDIAVYRPTEGNWYIITSHDRFARLVNWGTAGDRPVPADYDGDGRVDVAVFRPSTGAWYIRAWTNAVTVRGWGDATDVAVPADYDGDGKTDIAVFRPSEANWYIIESATNTVRVQLLGQNGVVPVTSASLPAASRAQR